MKKTLASLAVAMTSTAIALHWMDPSARAGRSSLTADEIESLARDVVGDAARIKKTQWRDVEITTDDELSGNGLALAASRDHRQFHFYVDAAGRPSRETLWTNQLSSPTEPHTVRIHLERATPDGPSSAQWSAARLLILALDSALSAKGMIPIHSAYFVPNTVLYSSSL